MTAPVFWQDDIGRVGWHCPGCGNAHAVPVNRWRWNGDLSVEEGR